MGANSFSLGSLIKKSISDWSDHNAPRLGAALAYYTVFSIAPLIIITITIAGLAFDNAQVELLAQIKALVGQQGSEAIESMIKAAAKPKTSAFATALGFVTLIFGAAGVFVQLKNALNTIWEVKTSGSRGIWGFLRNYLLSFGMVLGLGFLFLVSLLLTSALSAFGSFVQPHLPALGPLFKVASFAISFGVISLLFATLFKFLPDTPVAWWDVWMGAAITSLLFTIGKSLLGIYIAKTTIASAYGVAGSLVIVLLWVYYSAQILFLGAEFTHVFSKNHGTLAMINPKGASHKKAELIRRTEALRERMSLLMRS